MTPRSQQPPTAPETRVSGAVAIPRRTPHRFSFVDATPTRNHIASLHGHAWSNRAIAAATDGLVSDKAIGAIARGRNRGLVRDYTEWAILEIDPEAIPGSTVKGRQPRVSKVGAVRRIQALLAIGWTHEHISKAVGFQTGSFIHYTTAGLCLLSTHRKVAAAYRRLSVRPGPSERTRALALRRGYATPAQWDDIDRDEAPESAA